jgi:hypothetical protein
MSVGLGKSYQCVGLNRLGAYLSVAKTKGPPADKSVCATVEKPNEIWRRITGIYPGVKQTAQERKRGLRILARRIQERVGRGGRGMAATEVATTNRLSLADDWTVRPEAWARVKCSGVSIEGLCVELGCTHARLTMLLKEYSSLSASEFIDGLNFVSLKQALTTRLRETAEAMWGYPGSFVAFKLSTDGTGEGANGTRSEKRSRYFHTRPEELFEESRTDERERRVGELCDRLRFSFDLESLAISAGYASGAKLKRACLNVLGKTLREIERMLAAEVVQFYLCAEDRELREIASREKLNATVARARELYHGSDDAPVPPFVDEWAKFEELKAEWLSRMRDMFG